jgi:hypothetical protein
MNMNMITDENRENVYRLRDALESGDINQLRELVKQDACFYEYENGIYANKIPALIHACM